MKRLLSPLLFAALTTACATGPSKGELDDEVRRLCAIDGGVKVYETVVLLPEKFNKYGNVRIPLKKYLKPGDDYFHVWEHAVLKPGNPDSGGPGELYRNNFKYYRAADQKLLGEDISYARRGGDIPGPHPSSFRCPTITKGSGIESQIFLKGADQ